jgi:putative ABC transport system permease protein
MLRNYFILAVRNLLKHRVNALINILGLAVGLACCLLMALYVWDEWTFDTFHSKADRIYRPYVDEKYNGETYLSTNTPFALAPALDEYVPEVEKVTKIFLGDYLVRPDAAREPANETVHFTTPEFFEIFDFKLLEGRPSSLLTDRHGALLTQSMARKYFGEGSPLGKRLQIKLDSVYTDLTVEGLVEDPPAASSLQFGILLSAAYEEVMFSEQNRRSWSNVTPETYVLRDEKATQAALERNAQAMLPTVLGPDYKGDSYFVGFQPLTDIHLNPDLPVGNVPVSNRKYAYILAGVALLVLLIACINFMTLSIGQSVARAREIAVRKATGARRIQLVGQFLGETFLTTLLAVVLSLALASAALPLFRQVTDKTLTLPWTGSGLLTLVGLTLLVTALAGAYPALILSGLRPVAVLKGQLKVGGSGRQVRAGMVVVQFVFSIFLISSALIMQRQLRFMQNRALGYQKEHLLTVPFDVSAAPGVYNLVKTGIGRGAVLKQELLRQTPGLQGSVVMHSFENGWTRAGYLQDETGKQRCFRLNVVDAEYLPTAGMELVQGRGFDPANVSDAQRAIVVNEALVREYGWENPVGQRLPGKKFKDHEVIGVVRDFNFESLHTPVEPLVLVVDPLTVMSGMNDISFASSPAPKLLLRIEGASTLDQLDRLKTAWKSAAPGEPFNFSFVDEALDRQYRRESNLRRITIIASALAVAVALFGLFGLASLNIGARVKEIGIRKVLGASVPGIFALIARDFVRLVLIALVLAVPLSWYFMRQWLQDFAYRVSIDAGVFAIAGLLTLALTVLTISFQATRAALANPVRSLRSE